MEPNKSNNNNNNNTTNLDSGGKSTTPLNGHSRNNSLDPDTINPILNPYLTKIFDQNDPFTSRRLSGFLHPEAVNYLESQHKSNLSINNIEGSISTPNSTNNSFNSNLSTTSTKSSSSTTSISTTPIGTTTSTTTNSTSTTLTSVILSTSPNKVISNKTLLKKAPQTNLAVVITNNNNNSDDESSSSEEEYDTPTSQQQKKSSLVPSRSLSYLDLGDVIVLKILGYLHSDDLCLLNRANKYFCNIINSSQILWKNLNVYYMKTFNDISTSSLDINLWEEEMYTSASSSSSSTTKNHLVVGTVKLTNTSSNSSNSSSKQLENKFRSQTISNIGMLPKFLNNNSSNSSNNNNSSSSNNDAVNNLTNLLSGKDIIKTTVDKSVDKNNIENIDQNVLILNNLIRKLTPTTSVPSTDEVQEFVDGCHLYPIRLLIRKLIQRYLVPREFNASLSDSEWQKIVERPVQLRVGKILRKVVDHKLVVFDYPSIVLLKTFIKGYIQPQSEMSRGLNQGLAKKVKSSKAWEITRLSESLLSKVFRNFELVDLSRCSRVCRKWNKTIANSDLWEQLYHYYRRKLLKSFDPTCQTDVNIWEDTALNCYENIITYLSQTSPMMLSPTPLTPSPTTPSSIFSPSLQSQQQSQTPPSILAAFPPLPPKPPPLSLPTSFSDDNINYLNVNETSSPSLSIDSSPENINSPPPTIITTPTNTTTSSSGSNLDLSSINKEKEKDVQNNNNSRHMNLNQIVDKLTSVTFVSDISEVNAFLATYRNFISTTQLVEKLLQRYHIPRPNNLNFSILDWRQKIEAPIQHKVCKVLKKVIDDHFSDFNPLVLAVFKIFLIHIIDKHSALTSHLIRSFSKKLFYKDTMNSTTTADDEKKLKSSKSQSKIGWMISGPRKPILTDIMTIQTDEIAKQFTLIEFEIYSKIQTSEFINQAWSKEKTRHLAPNIRAAIDRFNLVTKWVCTVILKEEKIRSRTKIMSKIIKIAKTLRSFGNYHTLMAILSGLNEAPVYRLKHTRNELKPKIQKLATELQTLMSVEGNHDAYRNELSTIDQKQSCIPYLGVYLKDITFLQDDTNKSSDGGINMKQSKNIYNVLKIIQIFQKNPYTFEENPKVKESLQGLQILTEDNLYLLSYSREPRNSKRSDLV